MSSVIRPGSAVCVCVECAAEVVVDRPVGHCVCEPCLCREAAAEGRDDPPGESRYAHWDAADVL